MQYTDTKESAIDLGWVLFCLVVVWEQGPDSLFVTSIGKVELHETEVPLCFVQVT
jgi:hypothetical protein